MIDFATLRAFKFKSKTKPDPTANQQMDFKRFQRETRRVYRDLYGTAMPVLRK